MTLARKGPPMIIIGVLASIALVLALLLGRHRRARTTLLAAIVTPLLAIGFTTSAGADIVPAVGLGTASNFSVMAGTTVTNSGPTTLQRNLGLSPGSDVTGFPPGVVTPPATQEVANEVAVQAQNDLSTAYTNAEGRAATTLTGAELAGQTLEGGVFRATADRKPLLLTGTVTLDGANNSDSVWIFQTDSTLTTGTGAVVRLINGASACNVFWQIGSSATIAGSTTFIGTLMALTSITLQNAVSVNGRMLARNGAVTMINDTFTGPDCTPAPTTTVSVPTTIPSSTTGAPTTVAEVTTTQPEVTIPGVTTTQPEVTIPGVTTTQPEVTIPGVTTTQPGVTTTQPGATTTLAAAVTTTQPGATTTQAGATTTVAQAAATTTTAARSSTTVAGASGTVTTQRLGAATTSTTAHVVSGGVTTTTARTLVTIPRTGRSIRVPMVLSGFFLSVGGLVLALRDRRMRFAA
jgi:hypothetical protein